MIAAEMQAGERRKIERIPVSLPVMFRMHDCTGEWSSGTTRDASGDGLFFFTEDLLIQGVVVELVMSLPPSETVANELRMHCLGRVVRVEDRMPEPLRGMAVAFVDVNLTIHERPADA